MTDLKPCPFCGGEASIYEEIPGGYIVQCHDCCGQIGIMTIEHAIAAWNARADTEYGAVPATDENMAKYGWVRERTCQFTIKDNMNESEGMGDVWIECSACHCVFDFYADEWLMKMSYCPNCGAKVVGE